VIASSTIFAANFQKQIALNCESNKKFQPTFLIGYCRVRVLSMVLAAGPFIITIDYSAPEITRGVGNWSLHQVAHENINMGAIIKDQRTTP
jgi:hypothetical protein